MNAVTLEPVIAEDGDFARVGRVADRNLNVALDRLIDDLFGTTLFRDAQIGTAEVEFLNVEGRQDAVVHLGQETRQVACDALVTVSAEDNLPSLVEPLAGEVGVQEEEVGDVDFDLVTSRVEDHRLIDFLLLTTHHQNVLVGVGTQATGDDVADEGVVHQDREGNLFHDFEIRLNEHGEGRGDDPAKILAFGVVNPKNVEIVQCLEQVDKGGVVLLLVTGCIG